MSELVLGAANFGDTVGDQDACSLVAAALDHGINTFDTADVYAGGRSEEILGAALRHRRDQVILCSKVGSRVGDTEADLRKTVGGDRLDHGARWQAGIAPSDQGLSRKHLVSALESSLRRLGTDYIDLYQLHRFDPHSGVEEVLRTLDDMVSAGKVRYIGCSGWAAWQLYRGLWLSDTAKLARFQAQQVPYNLLDREAEREILPACLAGDVGVLAFRGLAGGLLGGRYLDGTAPPPQTRLGSREGIRARYLTVSAIAGAAVVADSAARDDRSATDLSIAWVLAQPGVTAMLFGASSPRQLSEGIAAIDRPLAADQAAQLARAVAEAVAGAQNVGR
ncbi:aldo/keto reductase [Frankia canadensis]|uniref:aldo/keto reductase n=1 Tax=Frankia canadensis TaxID=1836972 RepID=UPI0014027955|nr:aldo/keto reductase [Frankia canadensis]